MTSTLNCYRFRFVVKRLPTFISIACAAIGHTTAVADHGVIVGCVKSHSLIGIGLSAVQVLITVAGGCGGGNKYVVAEDLIAGDSDVIR